MLQFFVEKVPFVSWKKLTVNLLKCVFLLFFQNRYLKDDLKKMEKEYSSQTKKNLELSEKNRSLSLRLDQVWTSLNFLIEGLFLKITIDNIENL